MSTARHVMILASAGSGKTYALTSRFVRLLAEGAQPERIVALTFTRKAAGEFFDEILKKLAAAAAQADQARKLAAEIGRPELGPADFLVLLRAVTDAMPRLRLGTLDGFFARIARSFPLELGLAGEFELLQEHAARLERQRVLRRMFVRAGGLDEAQREFIEAFKRATFGREEKRLGAQLDAFLDAHQEIYLAAPDAARWGEPACIWPEGGEWLGRMPERGAALAALRRVLPWGGLNDKQRARLEAFFAEIPAWQPGAPLPKPVEYLVKNALAILEGLRAGAAELTLEKKKVALDGAASAALLDVLRIVVGGELARRLETTRGIFAVLQSYERIYHEEVRRAGKLTFADVQRLLMPATGAPVLTREVAGEGRLFVDYRLDAEIDHWLLDEFQDTSFGQWSVLRNLIDEVVQDDGGQRSFFCVGDVKQAIFTWREGDPRLFGEIFRHYNEAAPGTIVREHLVESWRSGPPLIEMVNTVFGDAAVMGELFPGPMSEEWNRAWRAHVSARPDHRGQAAWLAGDDEAARRRVLLEVLRAVRPLERGLTCAVLVQTNRAAAEVADFLRQEGQLPAVAESDLPVCTDNPLGAALLALVQVAAHPGDKLAEQHVRMTPLAGVLAAEQLLTPEALTVRVLRQIHAEGFESMLEWWTRALEPQLAAEDAFSRERARLLVDAARQFDATGSRDAVEFLAFMERHTVREPESAAVVRVMTIHKSKGLGFDVVLLPDLEGSRLDQARGGLAVHKAGDRSVEWVLDPPPKLWAENDTVLAAHRRQAEAEAGYEALSLLYVALTRAKRALYVITAPVGESTSRNYPKLLAETLGGGAEELREVRIGAWRTAGFWSAGEPDWPDLVVPRAATHAPAVSRPVGWVGAERGLPRWPARRPAERPELRVKPETLFNLRSSAAAEFGAAVHRLLAEVEWGTGAAALAAWGARGEAPEVIAEAVAVLQAPELAAVWTRPAEAVSMEVWRERAFEILLDEVWVSGVLDRVVVERDAAGRAVGVAVYDFKTEWVAGAEVEAAARRHREQMRLYRRAVARLTGLPEAEVAAQVVFTRLRRAVQAGEEG